MRSSLPLRAPQGTLARIVVIAAADDASKAVGSNASSVKAAFIEAGLSKAAVDRVITQYPAYIRWDVEQKLLPRLRRWQQELGDRFVSEIERVPGLLLQTPEEEQLKNQYLTSIGIRSPEILRRKNSSCFRQPLTSMQSKVAFLQQCGFTTTQTLSLVEQHSNILQCSFKHVEELLRVIGDMFDCADREALCDVMLSCRRMGVFAMSPARMHHNFTYYCTCTGADVKETQSAWKHGVFRASPAELDIRLDSIAAQLDATLDEAKGLVRRKPDIITLLPETVALHVRQLLGLKFSLGQVKSMCLRQPVLLKFNYNSEVHVVKWGFLTCVLRLSHDAVAACPHLLMSSLPNRLGPRWEYLQQLRLHGLLAFTAAPQVIPSLLSLTDAKFRAAHTTPQLPVYDEHFQKQWQRRWEFLLVDQQLSIQDIANQGPALLQIPFKDI